jgi:hypothetical protein
MGGNIKMDLTGLGCGFIWHRIGRSAGFLRSR